MDLQNFLDYGLAGVVIGALFWLNFHLGKRFDNQLDNHGDERKEWRAESARRDVEMCRALDGLTEALRNTRSL
tara:strand:- start:5 stop:223 length:219 start_codon:yes stop_codon:yes gene_type:complete